MPEISTIEDLRTYFGPSRKEFMELWTTSTDGQSLCALINGNIGWLMYLRENGDAGFSTRNPNYSGLHNAFIKYKLENGQVDSYPASWALPWAEVQKAIEHFIANSEPAPWLTWNNDSGDGVVIGQQFHLER